MTDAGPWTILKVMLSSAEYLESKGVESGRLDAEHLLAHVLGLKRLDLYLQFERPLEPEELDGFRPLLKRRANREPLQYILGRQSFRELELAVGPGVLIPRPETEELVGAVLERVGANGVGANDARQNGAPVALDIGTGSGAIALSLLVEGPFERCVGTDVSDEALDFARRNGEALGVGERLELRRGALFDVVEPDETFDVVVSNPPYVPVGTRQELQAEVVDWEPGQALFAGADGLDVITELVRGAPRVLKPGGLFALEVGDGQADDVVRILESTSGFGEISVRRDLAGKDRIVMATRTGGRGDLLNEGAEGG